MPVDVGFVHLHVHSSYSLLEGALPIARLAELAKADRQPALALTDTDNMFGALEFSDKMAGAGIQPIIGCALAVDFGDHDHGARPAGTLPSTASFPRLVLLAAREEGYRNLMRLTSRAFLDHPSNEPPHLKLSWLEGATDGMIALTGGPDGPLDRAIVAGQTPLLEHANGGAVRLFGGNLYVELQRHGTRRGTRHRERRLLDHRLCQRTFRSSPPTSRISRPPRITRRTTRCSASPKAGCWPRPSAGI